MKLARRGTGQSNKRIDCGNYGGTPAKCPHRQIRLWKLRAVASQGWFAGRDKQDKDWAFPVERLFQVGRGWLHNPAKMVSPATPPTLSTPASP